MRSSSPSWVRAYVIVQAEQGAGGSDRVHDGEVAARGDDVGLDAHVRAQQVGDGLVVPCVQRSDDGLGQAPQLQASALLSEVSSGEDWRGHQRAACWPGSGQLVPLC